MPLVLATVAIRCPVRITPGGLVIMKSFACFRDRGFLQPTPESWLTEPSMYCSKFSNDFSFAGLNPCGVLHVCSVRDAEGLEAFTASNPAVASRENGETSMSTRGRETLPLLIPRSVTQGVSNTAFGVRAQTCCLLVHLKLQEILNATDFRSPERHVRSDSLLHCSRAACCRTLFWRQRTQDPVCPRWIQYSAFNSIPGNW